LILVELMGCHGRSYYSLGSFKRHDIITIRSTWSIRGPGPLPVVKSGMK
jgi:hypothetical protein